MKDTYTLDQVLKAIEMARQITDEKDTFDVDSITGITEICTYDWRNKFTDSEIIESL
jgi:hypothetical protein